MFDELIISFFTMSDFLVVYFKFKRKFCQMKDRILKKKKLKFQIFFNDIFFSCFIFDKTIKKNSKKIRNK